MSQAHIYTDVSNNDFFLSVENNYKLKTIYLYLLRNLLRYEWKFKCWKVYLKKFLTLMRNYSLLLLLNENKKELKKRSCLMYLYISSKFHRDNRCPS